MNGSTLDAEQSREFAAADLEQEAQREARAVFVNGCIRLAGGRGRPIGDDEARAIIAQVTRSKATGYIPAATADGWVRDLTAALEASAAEQQQYHKEPA